MKATILYDEHGRILAISKAEDLKQVGSKFATARLIPGPGQRELEIELSEEQEKRPLLELHNEYRVELATSKLVKKH